MILEDEQIQKQIEGLKKQIEFEKKIIEMAEPFEMLLDNEYFKKVQSYYKYSADIMQKKINELNNDLVNDGAIPKDEDGNVMGLPENPVFHQLRISNIIGKVVVARDTLLSFSNEPHDIVERAKTSHEKIEKLTKELSELEGTNATGE